MVSAGLSEFHTTAPSTESLESAKLGRVVANLPRILYLLRSFMGATNIVSIRGLSKIYQQGEINVVALNNISLDIAQGE